MALKVTSGTWLSASEENRTQRNTLRDAFFAQAGKSPAKSLRDIYLAPAARIQRLAKNIEIATSPRIEGDGLVEIAKQAALEMALIGLAMPAMPIHVESQPLGLTAFAPETMMGFFETDQETALLRSLF